MAIHGLDDHKAADFLEAGPPVLVFSLGYGSINITAISDWLGPKHFKYL